MRPCARSGAAKQSGSCSIRARRAGAAGAGIALNAGDGRGASNETIFIEWKDGSIPFSGIIEVENDAFRLVADRNWASIDIDFASRLRRLLGPLFRGRTFNLVLDGRVFHDCELHSSGETDGIRIGRIG